jgi:hypothetical protein
VLSSCSGLDKKKKEKKVEEPAMKDANADVAFHAFLGQLRKAAAAHDASAMAPLMAENFGYHFDPPAEGTGVFQYWTENNLWPELDVILRQKFVPKGSYMVAPARFAADDSYHGSRAGMTLVNGGWKFAYFVTD